VLVALLLSTPAVGAPPRRAATPELRNAIVERVEWRASADGAEIVVHVKGPVNYATHVAAGDTNARLMPRSYLDLRPAKMGPALARSPIAVGDALLRQIRVGQFDQETVRIVVDLAEPAFFQVHTSEEPPRILLSLRRGGEEQTAAGTTRAVHSPGRPQPTPSTSRLAARATPAPRASPSPPAARVAASLPTAVPPPTRAPSVAQAATAYPTRETLAAVPPESRGAAVADAAPAPSSRATPFPVQLSPLSVVTAMPVPIASPPSPPARNAAGSVQPPPLTPPASVVPRAAPAKRGYTVVLDPGHGGRDPGAHGLGYDEKTITLDVAQFIADRLHGDERLNVLLTRSDDTYVSLEQRTAIANAQGADLFISIHINASENRELAGIETYTLNNTNDRATIRLAALENGLTLAGASPGERDLAYILSDLVQTGKEDESVALARAVHGELFSYVHSRWSDVTSLGVKKGPFYVLVGAYMPCVLVEVAFLTNEREGQRIVNRRYQQDVADGIAHGIRRFLATSAAHSNL
jgi:N-acetylmuramoyl-L-alanine amidase